MVDSQELISGKKKASSRFELFVDRLIVHLGKRKTSIIFLLIAAVSISLRFYNLQQVLALGLDQARDAWAMKEMIVDRKLPLIGPRTGVGHFHLGPLYYYLLVPFYFLTNLDPIASGYFALVASFVTLGAVFYVSRKVFSLRTACLSGLIYATSPYLVSMDRVPWNVSLVIITSVLIFYSLFKISQGENKWFIPLSLLTAFFFHVHATAVFVPSIALFSLMFMKNKKGMLPWIFTGGPFFILLFIPSLLSDTQSSFSNYYKIREFLGYYYHGFHFRFLVHRLPDALIQFEAILGVPALKWLKFLLPTIFFTLSLVCSKDQRGRTTSLLFLPWFLVLLVGFTLYAGPISDYYFLLTTPLVIYIVAELIGRALDSRAKYLATALVCLWALFICKDIRSLLSYQGFGGLDERKRAVLKEVEKGETIPYDQGNIESYLFYFYTRQ